MVSGSNICIETEGVKLAGVTLPAGNHGGWQSGQIWLLRWATWDARNDAAATRARRSGASEYIKFLRVAPGPVSREKKVDLALTQGSAQVPQSFFEDMGDGPMQGIDLGTG